MAQIYPYLALTYGSDACVLFDGAGGATNYAPTPGGWAPSITTLRQTALGGRGPYDDVWEELTINVSGSSVANAYANLRKLMGMLDRANRFRDGLEPTPVYIKMAAQGSDPARYVRAIVLEWDSQAMLASTWVEATITGGVIQGVRVRVRRRGLWTLDSYVNDNPVVNSSFERWSGGLPTSWISVNAPTIAEEPTISKYGGSSVFIQNPSTLADRGLSQDLPGLTVGAQYRVSVWVNPATSGRLRLIAWDGGGFANGVAAQSTGTGWQRLEVTKTAPASGIRILLSALDPAANGYFDGAMIEPLPSSGVASAYHLKLSEDQTSDTSAATALGTVVTVTFPAGVQAPSPLRLKFASFGTSPAALNGFVLVGGKIGVGGSSSLLAAIEAENLTASGYTSAADSANKASGNNVLRYTPSSTNYAASGSTTISPNGQRIAVFATVRNNSGSATWRIRAVGSKSGTGTSRTRPVAIDASTTNPRAIYVGMLVLPDPPPNSAGGLTYFATTISVEIAASTTSGPPTLDIDQIVVLVMDGLCSRAIALDSFSVTNDLLEIAAQYDTARDPLVGDSIAGVFATYRGDATLMHEADSTSVLDTTEATVSALILATSGTNWRATNAAGVISPTLTAIRAPAFLAPE